MKKDILLPRLRKSNDEFLTSCYKAWLPLYFLSFINQYPILIKEILITIFSSLNATVTARAIWRSPSSWIVKTSLSKHITSAWASFTFVRRPLKRKNCHSRFLLLAVTVASGPLELQRLGCRLEKLRMARVDIGGGIGEEGLEKNNKWLKKRKQSTYSAK